MNVDTLTDDDRTRLKAIAEERDHHQLVVLVGDYWSDDARRARTPTQFFYYHLGLLSGTVLRLLGKVADLEEQLRTERGEER